MFVVGGFFFFYMFQNFWMNIFFFVLPVASDWRQMFPFSNMITQRTIKVQQNICLNCPMHSCVNYKGNCQWPGKFVCWIHNNKTAETDSHTMWAEFYVQGERDWDSEYVNWLGRQPFRVNRSSVSCHDPKCISPITRTKSNKIQEKKKKGKNTLDLK